MTIMYRVWLEPGRIEWAAYAIMTHEGAPHAGRQQDRTGDSIDRRATVMHARTLHRGFCSPIVGGLTQPDRAFVRLD